MTLSQAFFKNFEVKIFSGQIPQKNECEIRLSVNYSHPFTG